MIKHKINTSKISKLSRTTNLSLEQFVVLEEPVLGYNWFDTRIKLEEQNYAMLTLLDFIDLLRLAKKENINLYHTIIQKKDTPKDEWIDTQFNLIGRYEGPHKINDLYLISHPINSKQDRPGREKWQIVQKQFILLKDKSINLESWIKNPSKKYGLPLETTPEGDLFYKCPNPDHYTGHAGITSEHVPSVAFCINSKEIKLDCTINPFYLNPVLGVRYARKILF